MRHDAAAAFWNSQKAAPMTRWWQSPTILRHINAKLWDRELSRPSEGLRARLGDTYGQFERAISIGCGVAGKEMAMLECGLVGHFDCFDIASARIETAKLRAARKGLTDRIGLVCGDGGDTQQSYDLVYWDNALHHMMDVESALLWSHDRLKPKGVVAINDYVGPNRMQFSRAMLVAASQARASLPTDLLRHCEAGTPVERKILRPDPNLIKDPSEAADSSRIFACASRIFPSGSWIMTGGCIYAIALNDIVCRLEAEQDTLKRLLANDDLLSAQGHNLYGVFVGSKGG